MTLSEPDNHDTMRLRALSSGLRGRGLSILHQTADLACDLAENIPGDWQWDEIIGRNPADAFPAEIGQRFKAACQQAVDTGHDQHLEFDLGEGLRRRSYKATLQRDGQRCIITIIADITEERAHEAAVAALLREVSHRSKNLLAIVQSVAMQTANHSTGMQDFLDKFRGRLHALSSTQDLVTESNWRGTYLHTLVTAQLTRVGTAHLAHVRVTGENPLLGPNASLHVGLAIHELAANAVLHGALAEDSAGQVWVDARIVEHPGQDSDLVIEWQEAGIDAGETVNQPRFGTLVLERIVPLSVGGTAQFYIEPDSVRYRLVIPSDQFEV
ncbi:MAG: HWE histidine kinase domain-containing protein [Candidatus Devosia phytovorans]|uniref:histidine kinase n=1 Tax=Candidatus Devosia phytovorans TaxID=3121372 RepID=A0AAJ5VX31_9HYPH|nr:PAS domain-containing sensor histidine kinase [Devosia sp.]WEK05072.1 MAG: HWE histidine kinase domain-containing protein [Devosia sp.]